MQARIDDALKAQKAQHDAELAAAKSEAAAGRRFLVIHGDEFDSIVRASPMLESLGSSAYALVLAVVLVVVSKVVGFQPGFVFGVIGGLALSDAVDERDDGLTLAGAAAAMLGVAFAAWWLWTPVAERVVQPDPGLWTLFLDAFLATLWLTCLQAVVFGLAPVRFLDGDLIRRWNGWAWLGLWALSVFVLVQCFLHPSAGRWGGLDTNSMWSAIAVFVVFLVAGVAFWAWFRFRPAPAAMADDPEDAVTS